MSYGTFLIKCHSQILDLTPDTLTVVVHSVKMPIGFGDIKRKGRTLANMVHLKTSIIEVRAEESCLGHALIIAIARLNNDPNYTSYRRENKIRPLVKELLDASGIHLKNGAGIPELIRFQEHLRRDFKIVVYAGLQCDSVMFQGQYESDRRINLLFDEVMKHYHVIANLTGAMAKRYVCEACNKGCDFGAIHVCDQRCSDCMASPRFVSAGIRIPCDLCNRHFRSRECFENHKKTQGKIKKSACDIRKCCVTCGA